MAIPIAATYSQMTMEFEVSHHTINFAVKRGYAQLFGVPEAMLSRLECQRPCSALWSARFQHTQLRDLRPDLHVLDFCCSSPAGQFFDFSKLPHVILGPQRINFLFLIPLELTRFSSPLNSRGSHPP